MNKERTTEETLIKYLLGESTEAEQSQLEQSYFNDAEFFEELSAVRRDLIDAYVRHELSPVQTKRFEQFFKTAAASREQIEFAKALAETADAHHSRTRPVIAEIRSKSTRDIFTRYRLLIVSAAAVVVITIALAIAINALRKMQPEQTDQTKLATPQPSAQPTPSQAESPQFAVRPGAETPRRVVSPESKPVVATIVLTSDLVRGSSETQKIMIPKSATAVQLRLVVEAEPMSNYEASIVSLEGRDISHANNLMRQPSGEVVLTLPAADLAVGDYIIRLVGSTKDNRRQSAGNYYFRVERR